MKKIYIITDYRGLYRQGISRCRGININVIKEIFAKNGYEVALTSYSEIINGDINKIQNAYIFYTSSESLEYKEYIKDIMYELGKRNRLIPGYDMLMCHEDKCYQEIYKKSRGITSLDAECFGSVSELRQRSDTFTYPVILKKYSGAGSISVYKADNKKQLLKIARKMNRNSEYYLYYARLLVKCLKKNLDSEYTKDDPYLGRILVQEFVPDLQNDWKVLIFGKKVYCLYRGIRDNDFRASGSGKFKYVKPPVQILDFAMAVFEKMQVPFLSLDLCMNDKKQVYLIEFQGLHFGPYTLIHSQQYYVKEDNKWIEKIEKSDLSREYANAVVEYIERLEYSI
ncbi:MAG: hypothetical protein J6D08_06625 [Lachnospiraceae bacterium]|nr:hypothetical protein [Lachnospiraceae bacterium]